MGDEGVRSANPSEAILSGAPTIWPGWGGGVTFSSRAGEEGVAHGVRSSPAVCAKELSARGVRGKRCAAHCSG
eukprot:scaffold194175_cov31-Tisochrysis_lutea.AAC.3